MKLITTLFLSLFVLGLHAQTFEEFISEGDRLYDEGIYLESAQTYSKAFEIKEGNRSQYYNAACSYALAGESAEAMKHLNQAVDKGWMNLKHIKRDKDLNTLHDTPEWEAVLTKIQANIDEYEKDFDKPLKKQLEAIYVRDQTLRQLYREAEEKFGQDSEEMKYFWSVVNREDSLNEVEVLRIIDERGWVGKSEVGGRANSTIWLVIQHAPLETQERYLPLLRESVLKGESRGSHLALLQDRIQMRNGKPQTYGSQITTDETTGKRIVYKIKDPEYVNKRRAEVGLGPIEEYVKRWDIEWTIEQKQ